MARLRLDSPLRAVTSAWTRLSRLPTAHARARFARLALLADAEGAASDAAAQDAYMVALAERRRASAVFFAPLTRPSHAYPPSPEKAVRRFERGGVASGAPGVAAYLSALATTGGLALLAQGGAAESGALPRLLAQLRERALGARAPLAVGERATSPLHVVVVDPRSLRPWPLRVASEAGVALLLALGLCVAWAGGAAALRRVAAAAPAHGTAAVASAPAPSSGGGGMGAAAGAAGLGGGGGAAFAPREYVKAELPERSAKTFADVLGCDEAKAELQEVGW